MKRDPFQYTEYRNVYEPIRDAIAGQFERLCPGDDWVAVAGMCAEEAIDKLVHDNAPRVWFQTINKDTGNEIQFICGDPTAKDEPLKEIQALPDLLEQIAEQIAKVLWYDQDGNADPDQPWTADNIERIAEIMTDAGYKPKEEHDWCQHE